MCRPLACVLAGMKSQILRASSLASLSVVAGMCLLPTSASAQWVTESYPLEAGWNAIWLSHDTAHDTIDKAYALTLRP